MISKYVRGMVYWANLPQIKDSSVQSGRRPVIIVSNDVGNIYSENVTVVPCTSNPNKDTTQPTHTTLKLFPNTVSTVLCENILTISKNILDGFIGILDINTVKSIDECIKIALGLVTNELTTIKDNQTTTTITTNTKKRFPEKTPDEEIKKFMKDYESKSMETLEKEYNMTKKQLYQKYYYFKKKLTNKK